ncbi:MULTISPECIES: S24/S26 family peptidase [Sphingobacterium]|uniref:S24/S26 family peptidase n=1 Tax=Sphingobacterium populi TaxID=1812824 RepID=A0ABW5UEC7_9SPHI|nr:S24/S26 family peptidase [Sphingobacterium sp. CFCC 11742]
MAKTLSKTIENHLFFQHVQEYIDDGKDVVFSVRGSSMSPFLKERDLITIKPLKDKDLKAGHIVLARYKKGYILHRVIRIDKEFLFLAGDANLVQIEKVDRNAVVGFLSEATRDKKDIPLYTSRMLCYAKLWYYIRPIRRVWIKLFIRKINP